MKNLSSKINSISCGSNIFITNDFKREIYYTINEEETQPIKITIRLPYSNRPETSNEIIDSDSEFVNGFKVVKTANGEYGYIRQSDSVLLPYRYDIASDFNQYGFAMVAKDGNTTWINKNFQYLSKDGEMVNEDIEDKYYKYRKFEGFQKICKFSTGNYPLSRIYEGRNRCGHSFYFSTEGKRKEFYKFDGSFDYEFTFSSFGNTDFGDRDYIIGGNGILFAKGYYCPLKYVLEFCEQNGIVSAIYENADKVFTNKGQQKVLKPKEPRV